MYLSEILLDAVHNKNHHKVYKTKLRIVRFNKDRAGLFIGCEGQSQYLSCGLSKATTELYDGKLEINDSLDAEVKVTKPNNNRLYIKIIKIRNIQHGVAPPTGPVAKISDESIYGLYLSSKTTTTTEATAAAAAAAGTNSTVCTTG